MKLEAGKFYRDPSGRMVRIYSVDNGPDYPVAHGAYLNADKIWALAEYDLDMSSLTEWIEPAPKLKAWITGDVPRTVVFYPDDKRPEWNSWRRAQWLDEP